MITSHSVSAASEDAREYDGRLMQLVQARKEWALELLFQRYVACGIRQAQRAGVDYQTAEDIVSEAFIKIWEHAEKYQPLRGSFNSWYHAIVHNLAIDELRRRQARSNAHLKSQLETMRALDSDNDAQLLRGIERIQVRDALAHLPEPQQRLLKLAYIEGMSRREIAQRLALPLGTVHTRVRLGKEKLKRLLQDCHPERGEESHFFKTGDPSPTLS